MTPCLQPNYLRADGSEYEFVARREGLLGLENLIPIGCGHCVSCRIKRAIEWKIRGVHEAACTFHPSYAVTLTYDQAHVPESGSLRKADLRAFHRRLRYQTGKEFRFMSCGEYGPTTGRPHYHSIYFGLQLPDVYRSGKHYISKTLLQAWGNGQITFHPATPQSIAYVSGYVVKKLRHHSSTEPIMETVDFDTGLIIDETPVRREFFQASNRPGIGYNWLDQFGDQVLDTGFIVMKEKPCYVIPSYYLKFLRDRPGFPAFQEKRLAFNSTRPDLSLEDLSALGIEIERNLASRAAV